MIASYLTDLCIRKTKSVDVYNQVTWVTAGTIRAKVKKSSKLLTSSETKEMLVASHKVLTKVGDLNIGDVLTIDGVDRRVMDMTIVKDFGNEHIEAYAI